MAVPAMIASFKRFLKKKPLVQRNTKINEKNVMLSLCCHGDSDCNKTQIMRNFHLYIIQLWQPFSHIFTHADIIA